MGDDVVIDPGGIPRGTTRDDLRRLAGHHHRAADRLEKRARRLLVEAAQHRARARELLQAAGAHGGG